MGWGAGVTPCHCCLGTPGALSHPSTGTCPCSATGTEKPHHDAAGQTAADGHKHVNVRGGGSRLMVTRGDTAVGRQSHVGGGSQRHARRTRLYLRRRLHCKRTACTMQTETGVRNNGRRQRGHAAARTRGRGTPFCRHQRHAHAERGLPRVSLGGMQMLPPGVGALPLRAPATPQAVVGSSSALPQGVGSHGRIQPGTSAKGPRKWGLEWPSWLCASPVPRRCREGSRSSTELGLGCSPRAGSGVPPPADPHEEAPELPKHPAAAGPCCPLVP